MNWRLTALTILLCVMAFVRDGFFLLTTRSDALSSKTSLQAPSDPESLLARGRPLPLRCVAPVDLELIPGITDRLARELVEAAPRLDALAKRHGDVLALQSVKGIGPERSASLAELLSLQGTCSRN